jgi:hydroxymethylbilane synthase
VRTLRIGTRRSALALAQAEEVRAALAAAGTQAEVVPMATTGDEGVPATVPADGLKGLWIDAILTALRNGAIDVAVHSAKDLPAEDEDDLLIAAVPRRADPRDVVVAPGEGGRLKAGMVVGTSSIRRRAQILARHPSVSVAALRGNVETRLRKVADGEVDAAILAAAGLARLGLDLDDVAALDVRVMLPAPGQGALAVQCRADARDVRAALVPLDHRPSHLALIAERALTRALGGGCALPLGALAAMRGDTVRLAARVIAPLGDRTLDAIAEATDPMVAATMVAAQLRSSGADQILAEVRQA